MVCKAVHQLLLLFVIAIMKVMIDAQCLVNIMMHIVMSLLVFDRKLSCRLGKRFAWCPRQYQTLHVACLRACCVQPVKESITARFTAGHMVQTVNDNHHLTVAVLMQCGLKRPPKEVLEASGLISSLKVIGITKQLVEDDISNALLEDL